ncbi:MAG: PQQ-dependent sugar dehydrogenase [bacterium]
MNIPDIIESFGFPVTLAFSAKGRAFFSERITGNIWEIKGDKMDLVYKFPIVNISGHHETGLIGIAVDPDFDISGYIYAFYTYGRDEYSMKNKVVRFLVGSGKEETILDNIPAGRIHNGGIIAFAPDKTLYIGVGIGNEVMDRSQDIDYLGGKVLRINNDGSIPKDNPYKESPVYSYGHRNIFGLAFHPKNGKLFISEDGPEKNDEINIIQPDGNYGWPEVTGKVGSPKFVDPIITYTPTITPTQCCFDEKYFYFGSYNDGAVHRLTLGGKDYNKVEKDETVYRGKSFGVIGVFHSPDHQFYVTTPNRISNFSPEVS